MGNGWRRRAERRLHRGRQAELRRRSAGFHRVRGGHLPGEVLPHESLDAAKALGAPIGLLSPAESCLPLVPCGPLCTACSRWARQVRLIQVSGRDGAMPRPRGRKARVPLSGRALRDLWGHPAFARSRGSRWGRCVSVQWSGSPWFARATSPRGGIGRKPPLPNPARMRQRWASPTSSSALRV